MGSERWIVDPETGLELVAMGRRLNCFAILGRVNAPGIVSLDLIFSQDASILRIEQPNVLLP